MRWKQPDYGAKRTITKFLFFPKRIRGETRWLEIATFEQEYLDTRTSRDWLDWKWVDTESQS
jgi:hypothetical protein